MEKIIISNQDVFCTLWFMGWLFTIGFLDLKFWRGVLAFFVWPYFIGKKYGKK